MNEKVCTCGVTVVGVGVDVDIVGLPESHALSRIASAAGFAPLEAARLLRAIAGAAKEDTDSIVAWLVREQHRLLKVAKEKSDAKAAAIARASGER